MATAAILSKHADLSQVEQGVLYNAIETINPMTHFTFGTHRYKEALEKISSFLNAVKRLPADADEKAVLMGLVEFKSWVTNSFEEVRKSSLPPRKGKAALNRYFTTQQYRTSLRGKLLACGFNVSGYTPETPPDDKIKRIFHRLPKSES